SVPPALPVVPQLLQVLENGRVSLHASLPQVIEIRVRRETGDRSLRIGEIDGPGVLREQFLDVESVFDRKLLVGGGQGASPASGGIRSRSVRCRAPSSAPTCHGTWSARAPATSRRRAARRPVVSHSG